ncbi:MAG: hypothetical protein KJ057_05485 [Phycisphaerae bacterium]|nr:MAG: hypothetical protein F9K17_07915 [Phycisphaerae bacterium]MBE7456871.1 hypothetical protein [Planctomycetia bacterium]MCK6464318.1 hypothetical protein [Phycisphaerae bacterium]MCL4717911.1 hypothetical protein [Phycisphaerae bacterium]NUQ07462.1 hypothetical protein [Phycisphaerae bacterium]
MVVVIQILALLLATPHFTVQDRNSAQSDPPPRTREEGNPPTAESIIEAMAKRRAGAQSVLPNQRGAVDGNERPELLVEGTPIIDRSGRLVEVGGKWTFVFDGSSEEPPIELLPNLMLERMIYQAASDRDGTVLIVQHGEVTEFQGRNYLLVRTATVRMPDRNLTK